MSRNRLGYKELSEKFAVTKINDSKNTESAKARLKTLKAEYDDHGSAVMKLTTGPLGLVLIIGLELLF